MIGKTALPVKAWKAEYAKLTAERETLNRRQLAAGTEGAAAPQGAGYGTITVGRRDRLPPSCFEEALI